MTDPLPLTLYSGPGCCLCDQAKEALARVAADTPLSVAEVDIHSDPALLERYRYRIPVITHGEAIVIEGKVAELWLRRALAGLGVI